MTISHSTPGRRQTGGAGEVDGGLGVAGSLEHPARAVAQREDVTGPVQIVRSCRGVDERRDGGRAVGGRDPRGRPVPVVDADREGGALRLRVGRDHQGQVEQVRPLGHQRHADHARGMGQEERDVLRRGRLGRHDQVTLVLPVLVVDDDGHAQAADAVNRLLHVENPIRPPPPGAGPLRDAPRRPACPSTHPSIVPAP